jgi:hypothetical protein
VAVCANEGFGVAAYATECGRLAIVAIADGRLLGEAETGEMVNRLIVTAAWGFVLAEADLQIRTFALSGVELASMRFGRTVVHWAAFEANGADFVAVLDGRGQIQVFDAVRPETLRVLAGSHGGIVAMRGCGDGLVVVTADGKVRVVPLPGL